MWSKRTFLGFTLVFFAAFAPLRAQAGCTKAATVKTTWEQVICPGTANERTVTKEGSYTIYYGVPGCEGEGGTGGGGSVPPPPSGGSGGGGGGGQSGGGGSDPGGSSTTIEPLTCFKPGCIIKYFFGECEKCTGSSVILTNGTYNFTETDLALPARGIPVEWSRHYRSNRILPANGGSFAEPADGPLGFGWATPYFARIEGGDTYVDGEGIYTVFKKDSAGNFLPDQINGLVLKKISNGFELQEVGGLISTFDVNGRLQAIRDRFGNAVTLEYNAERKLAAIVDATGRQALVFAWNASGRIESVTDAAGRTVFYTYDAFGNLTNVDGLSEARSVFTYNTYHGLTSKANALGETYTIDYEYPDRGIVKKVIDPIGSALIAEGKQPTGHVQTFGYDFQNSAFYVTDPDGATRKTTANADGRLTSESLVDGGGTLLKKVEHLPNRTEKITDAAGNVTTLQRDEWMNIIRSVDGEGNATRITWNSQKRPAQITDPSGVVTRFEYDPSGTLLLKKTEAAGLPEERVTTYTYATFGELESVTVAGATTTIAYNDAGQPVSITDPLGNVSRLEYDTAGNIVAAVGADGKRFVFTYDEAGNPLTVQDPLGHVTTLSYNAAGRLTQSKDPLGRLTQIETDFKERITAIADALNHRKEFQYDGAGNLVRITDGDAVTVMAYDESGRLLSVTDPAGNVTGYEYADAGCSSCGASAAVPKRVTDPFGNITESLFDKNGKVIGVQDPLQNLTGLARDALGRAVRRTDGNGNLTSYQYDPLGRVTRQIDARSDETTFTYDQRRNLTTLADPEGHTTRFEHDLAGRKTKEIRPMGQATEYAYTPSGLLKTVKDAKEQVTTYVYDAATRLTEITYADGRKDAFGYDAVGNLTDWSGAEGVSGSAAYDELNRMLSETVNYGPFSKTFSYTYDARGNKTSYTSSEGLLHSYTYDKGNKLTAIAFDGKTVSLAYDKTRLKRITFPNGVSTDYTHNPSGWLTGITTTGPSGTILSREYGFDKVGNILAKNSEHGPYIYGYDPTYQLTSADNPTHSDEYYSYDKVSNRLSSAETATPWSYNDNNELISDTRAVFEYDGNGNTVKKTENGQVTTYVYNARNRLEKVYLPDGRVAFYAYDPFGRRIRKVVANEVTYFSYADEGLVGEYDESGTLKKAYGWKPDGLWGTDPLYMAEGGSVYFYHNDHLGMPQKLIDASGQTVWSASYAAFGKALVGFSTITSNLRFPGQYFDEETGLHWNWQRYYDPGVGRYVEADPLGLTGGLNIYWYTKNQPLVFIDPLGLAFITPEQGQLIVNVAKSYRGVPYFDGGGEKSSREKTDCSGSVWLIYNEAGFETDYFQSPNFPNNSRFKPAPSNIPQQGDVGWWNGHVLIYDGNAGKLKTGQEANAWSARNSKHPFGPVPTKWWSDEKGPVKWYRYDTGDSASANRPSQRKECNKCSLPKFETFPDPSSFGRRIRMTQ